MGLTPLYLIQLLFQREGPGWPQEGWQEGDMGLRTLKLHSEAYLWLLGATYTLPVTNSLLPPFLFLSKAGNTPISF